jgi:hypothetical protein
MALKILNMIPKMISLLFITVFTGKILDFDQPKSSFPLGGWQLKGDPDFVLS